jgi:hypothetical protein
MHALGKSPSAKLRVRALAMARPWARVRPHRLSFLLGGDDPENRLVEEIPSEGFGDTSRPFAKPKSGRIAVKVINHLGDEVMKVFRVA